MNKSQIIKSIAADSGATQNEVEGIVDAFLNVVGDQVAASTKVQLDDFGTFQKRWVKERQGRNPKTGAAITIPGRFKIVFKPYKKLEDAAQTIL